MLRIDKAIFPDNFQLQAVIRGMRNPYDSWDKSDNMGEADLNLMRKLADGGSVHAKYRRMMVVYLDIVAPLYWWKEFDTYKVGTVCNSCSTMHTIQNKKFEPMDFSCEHLDNNGMAVLDVTIAGLNVARLRYQHTKDKQYWWQMIQLLPTSYNQKRTVMLNYEVLANIYKSRRTHRLDEWVEFCNWIERVPYFDTMIKED